MTTADTSSISPRASSRPTATHSAAPTCSTRSASTRSRPSSSSARSGWPSTSRSPTTSSRTSAPRGARSQNRGAAMNRTAGLDALGRARDPARFARRDAHIAAHVGLDLDRYANLGDALADAIPPNRTRTALIEADRHRETSRSTYSAYAEVRRTGVDAKMRREAGTGSPFCSPTSTAGSRLRPRRSGPAPCSRPSTTNSTRTRRPSCSRTPPHACSSPSEPRGGSSLPTPRASPPRRRG